MTAPTTTPSDSGFYGALARLHGHRCPMSILGARLGLAAREALGGHAEPGARLVARYAHRTCALDGIQLATSCTPGNRNLEVDPRGEHRLDLWFEGSSRAVCASLTAWALDRGRSYAALRDRAEALPLGSPGRRLLEEEMDRVLAELETAPASRVVAVAPHGGG